MSNDLPHAANPLGSRLSKETIEQNRKLLARINSKSLILAPAVKGSLYFYIDTHGADNQRTEELIDHPSALDFASNELGIDIRNEDKHHRWIAQTPQALKILEFATIYLKQKNHDSSGNIGVNVELKWRDERDLETIIHLSQSKDNAEWQVTGRT